MSCTLRVLILLSESDDKQQRTPAHSVYASISQQLQRAVSDHRASRDGFCDNARSQTHDDDDGTQLCASPFHGDSRSPLCTTGPEASTLRDQVEGLMRI